MRQHPVRRTVSITAAALALLALGTATPAAHAVTSTAYTWVGSSQDPPGDNHSWTDPLNWSPNGVPGDGDSVSIAPPDSEDCVADVDNVPTVALQDFSFSIAGQCGANINGGGPITVMGTMTWDSGRINAPLVLAAGATANVDDGLEQDAPELANDMTVDGGLNLSGDLWMEGPTQLIIAPTGTMVASAQIRHSDCCMNQAKLVDDGSLTVSDGGLFMEDVEFDQSGAVELDGGGLLVTVGGPVELNDGGSISSSTGGGSWIMSTDVTLSGTQTLGANVYLQLGDAGDQGFGPGTLRGDGGFKGSGQLDWVEGTINADLTVGHGVTVTAVGSDPPSGGLFLGGYQGDPPVTLTDHGKMLLMYSDVTMRGQARLQIAKNGSLTLPIYRTVSGDGEIDNSGRVVAYVHHGSDQPAAETAPVTFDSVGYVDNGGTTVLDKHADLVLTGGAASSFSDSNVVGRGWLTIADPTTMAGTVTEVGPHPIRVTAGGSISGSAQIAGGVQNYGGVVDPGSLDGSADDGTLSVTGNYTQGAGGKLHVDLSSTGSDQLVVGGVATLAGTVVANNFSGYAPTRGESRTVVTSAGLTWKVTCVVTGGQGSKHGHWQPVAGETDLGLTWRRGSQTSC